jgi:hypothetical protein
MNSAIHRFALVADGCAAYSVMNGHASRCDPLPPSSVISLKNEITNERMNMNTFSACTALFIAAGLGIGATHANEVAAPAKSHASTPQRTDAVVVTPGFNTPLSDRQIMERYRGSYALEDGRSLSLNRNGQQLFVEIGAAPQLEIEQTAPGEFVSRDGRTTVVFRVLPNGVVETVSVILRARV